MNANVMINKTLVKTLIAMASVLVVGWVSWVSAGVIDAKKETVRTEAIAGDIAHIRARMDKIYDKLISEKPEEVHVKHGGGGGAMVGKCAERKK